MVHSVSPFTFRSYRYRSIPPLKHRCNVEKQRYKTITDLPGRSKVPERVFRPHRGRSGEPFPPLVALLANGSSRWKKDAITTLYKLCSVRLNKQRTVRAEAVRPLVGLVAEKDSGLTEKIMAVLSSLNGIELGRKAIVEEGGMAALLEVIENGTDKGKEFAVWILLQLCRDNVENIGFFSREWGIPPPLLTLSLTGTSKAKNKAKRLIRYLSEPRLEASSSKVYMCKM